MTLFVDDLVGLPGRAPTNYQAESSELLRFSCFSLKGAVSGANAKLFQQLGRKVPFGIKLFNLFYHPMRITTGWHVRVIGNRLVRNGPSRFSLWKRGLGAGIFPGLFQKGGR
jgi:hypothetical protein